MPVLQKSVILVPSNWSFFENCFAMVLTLKPIKPFWWGASVTRGFLLFMVEISSYPPPIMKRLKHVSVLFYSSILPRRKGYKGRTPPFGEPAPWQICEWCFSFNSCWNKYRWAKTCVVLVSLDKTSLLSANLQFCKIPLECLTQRFLKLCNPNFIESSC